VANDATAATPVNVASVLAAESVCWIICQNRFRDLAIR
jgi:hypothetical protein